MFCKKRTYNRELQRDVITSSVFPALQLFKKVERTKSNAIKVKSQVKILNRPYAISITPCLQLGQEQKEFKRLLKP